MFTRHCLPLALLIDKSPIPAAVAGSDGRHENRGHRDGQHRRHAGHDLGRGRSRCRIRSACRVRLRAGAPGAHYARAFNTLGWENFAEPPADADLFFAADPAARAAVEELISATGLAPVYVGNAAAAGTVDALLPLWFALVQQSGGNRKLALRVVR
jgi:hypothetical protein